MHELKYSANRRSRSVDFLDEGYLRRHQATEKKDGEKRLKAQCFSHTSLTW